MCEKCPPALQSTVAKTKKKIEAAQALAKQKGKPVTLAVQKNAQIGPSETIQLELNEVDKMFLQQEPKKPWKMKKGKGYSYTMATGKQNAKHVNQMLKDEGLADNWVVELADDYHLQLDFDEPEVPKAFWKQLAILKHFVPMEKMCTTESKSGNKHVIIKLVDPIDAYTRVGLQAALGSDPVREMLNFRGLVAGEKDPILLIEDKYKKPMWIGIHNKVKFE